MGSNQNRFFDKGMQEWGSKVRKEESHSKKNVMQDAAIKDSELDGKHIGSKKRRKKDTKRWCRGKVGREHSYEVIETFGWFSRKFVRRQCSGCQKIQHERLN